MGEFVTLVREPTNAYDANAIRVLNQAGTQVCLSRLCGVCMCVCFPRPRKPLYDSTALLLTEPGRSVEGVGLVAWGTRVGRAQSATRPALALLALALACNRQQCA